MFTNVASGISTGCSYWNARRDDFKYTVYTFGSVLPNRLIGRDEATGFRSSFGSLLDYYCPLLDLIQAYKG
jgi:hypothetical protein